MRPDTSVPVTTVPNPRSVKTRSIGRRGGPSSGRARRTRAASNASARVSRIEPGAGHRRYRHDRRIFEKRPGDELTRIGRAIASRSASARSLLVSAMTPGAHVEQPADVEMLARLRHDRFVRGDDQQHRVDAGGAGEHVAHEALVPRARPRTRAPRHRASVCAKPRSMVIPRSCSSFRRSGSMPVSARTSALLP